MTVRVRGPAGTREHSESELPLVLGARPGAALPLSGPEQPDVAGFVGLRGGRFYIQAAPGAASVSVNDEPLSGASRWLEAGDELRVGPDRWVVDAAGETLVVSAPLEEGPATEPPVVPDSAPEAPGPTGGETLRPAAFSRSAWPAPAGRRRPPRWGLIVGLPALVLALFAWFVFTARPVRVVVDPVPETLELAGGLLTPAFGERFLLRPGRYTVRATLDGYRPLEAGFEVAGDGPSEVRFELEKLPDVFTITSGEVAGAEVRLDGSVVGVTPLEGLEIRPGAHQVRVEKPRYLPWEIALEVDGGGQARRLEAELAPNWADVTFASAPDGARIRVDGVDIGQTPLVAQVEAGLRELVVEKDGYKTWREQLTVEAGVSVELPPVTLAPADGRLVISSTPPGASVLVEGRFRGQTPLDVAVSPGERLKVQVRKAGFETASRSVSVASGATQRVSVSLAPVLGIVEISVSPPDAELRIGGEPVVPVEGRLELPAVEQRIEVSRDGYAPETVSVTPRPGIVQRLSVNLETVAEAKAAALPRRIVTSQGQELVLVDPGRFTMGSSRREPGRRSNETLRDVEITRPFYISTTEVSNDWFGAFRSGHYSGDVAGLGLDGPRQPVVGVTWNDAAAFCNWLSARDGLPAAYRKDGEDYVAVEPPNAGYRLPTEAEWAWAGRFEGRTGNARRYPWGETMPPPQGAGNFADESARGALGVVIANYNDAFPATAPVGTFGNNALGLKDVGGNVAEWVHDLYGVYPPGESVAKDPRGAATGQFHVIRGSSWMHSGITELRMSFRDYGNKARPDLGFRIARSLE